jgi:arabinofuranosyltransferase
MAESLLDVLATYLLALQVAMPVAIAGALLLFVLELRRPTLPPLVRRLAGGALILAALSWAWHLRWICDDAFISFRYSDNFAHGRGLIWNVGERVEGYTNFLWTVLAAGAIRVGLDPGQFVVVLDLACFVATLFVVARLSRRLSVEPGATPLAAILVGANYTFASFGTSGLETGPAALAVTLSLERVLAGAPLAAGLAGVVAVFLHPDHVLLSGALGLALLLGAAERKGALRYAAPFVLLYLPYFAWRWHYYGAMFPNTFYAKSGGGSYFSQGGTYLWASLFNANFWAVLPVAAYGLWKLRSHLVGRYAAIALPLYLGYVAKIGGDYMLGRLLVAVLPLLAVLAEVGLRSVSRRAWAVAALGGLAFSAIPTPLLEPQEVRWYLTDERTQTSLASFAPIRIDSGMFERGELFRRAFADAGLNACIADTEIGMVGYLSHAEVIDYFGLTDWEVAHQPLGARGRPGHEKKATVEYLRSRKVDLARLPLYPPPYSGLATVSLLGRPDSIYNLARYDETILAALKKADPNAHAVDFPQFLDHYLATEMATRDRATVRQDLETFFVPYYFANHPADTARRARIDAYLATPG